MSTLHTITKSLLIPICLSASICSLRASVPHYDDIMPISQVKAGMVGYGLTVFRGTKIERFGVKVVGVVKKGSLAAPGHDMILVQMSGGPMTSRGAYIIHGMSGSPVYINGKIIGAFSQGEPNSKEPLGGVTPIEDMLDSWDPKLPTLESSTLGFRSEQSYTLKAPIIVRGRSITKVVTNVPESSALKSIGSTLVMHPCTTFASFNCTSPVIRERLANLLKPYNVELIQGVSGQRDPSFKGTALAPGAAFGMMLVSGDQSMGAFGTVTYRKANQLLGFGHPFMGIGAIDAALCSAWVYDVYPLTSASYKICGPGPIVGSSTQDRLFSVGGTLGKQPKLIPMTVDVRDTTTGRSKVFHSQVATHPNLYSALVSTVAGASISEIRSVPGPAMAKISTTLDVEGFGKITRSNICFDARSIDGAATADLDDLLSILTSNPFYPVGVVSADIKVEIYSGKQTAQVEKVFVTDGKYEPGQIVPISLVLKPYKQPAITKVVNMQLPNNIANGRYAIQVKGGAAPAALSFGGFSFRPQSGSSDQAPPTNIKQMLTRYEQKEKNNEIVAKILLTTSAVNVDGEKLSELPAHLDAIMRSTKVSGVRLERDEIKIVVPTDYVVSGQQLITIQVQKKNTLDSGATPIQPGAPGVFLPQGFSSANQSSLDNELASVSNSTLVGDPTVYAAETPNNETMLQKGTRSSQKSNKSSDTSPGNTLTPAAIPASIPASIPTERTDLPNTPPGVLEKPVGRIPQVWKQSAKTDFVKGDLRGVSVNSTGNLVTTGVLSKFASTGEQHVWAIANGRNSSHLVGTGPNGKIVEIDSVGKSKLFVKLPEQSIYALIESRDNGWYAATGPHGRTYKINADGSFNVIHEATEKYALCLSLDPLYENTLFIGTGGGSGKVYRVSPKTSFIVCKPNVDHILSLAMLSSGSLLIGTGAPGMIYRYDRQGKTSVAYENGDASVTALAGAKDDGFYAATSPRNTVVHVDKDGVGRTVLDRAPSAIMGLTLKRNVTGAVAPFQAGYDSLSFAIAGNQVYQINADDTTTTLDSHLDGEFTAILGDGSTGPFIGSSNSGDVFRISPVNTEWSVAPPSPKIYTSVVRDAKSTSTWSVLRLNASIPAGSSVIAETRTGNGSEPDNAWSPWAPVTGLVDGMRIASPMGRYLQYRLLLTPEKAGRSPEVKNVAIDYLPANSAPKVSFQSLGSGDKWSGKQNIRWEASDADKDTLAYELYYSPDSGKTWVPAPGAIAKNTPVPASTSAVPSGIGNIAPIGSGPPTPEAVQAELDHHNDIPAALRAAVIERARKVQADFLASDGNRQSVGGISTVVAGRETTRTLDTEKLPDGTYLLKVIASDKPSNPVGYLSAEVVSDPIIVCNSLPVIIASPPVVSAKDKTILIEGIAVQKMVAITAVQYRVDGGDWVAAIPKSGLFDSTLEAFQLTIPSMPSGSHVIEIKAFNAAGGTSMEKVSVSVS